MSKKIDKKKVVCQHDVNRLLDVRLVVNNGEQGSEWCNGTLYAQMGLIETSPLMVGKNPHYAYVKVVGRWYQVDCGMSLSSLIALLFK